MLSEKLISQCMKTFDLISRPKRIIQISAKSVQIPSSKEIDCSFDEALAAAQIRLFGTLEDLTENKDLLEKTSPLQWITIETSHQEGIVYDIGYSPEIDCLVIRSLLSK